MDVENVIYIFVYNFANVVWSLSEKYGNIFPHLYNKKVLKYGEQDVVFVNLVWVILEVTLVYIISFNLAERIPSCSDAPSSTIEQGNRTDSATIFGLSKTEAM